MYFILFSLKCDFKLGRKRLVLAFAASSSRSDVSKIQLANANDMAQTTEINTEHWSWSWVQSDEAFRDHWAIQPVPLS